jgi:hypothetical protein
MSECESTCSAAGPESQKEGFSRDWSAALLFSSQKWYSFPELLICMSESGLKLRSFIMKQTRGREKPSPTGITFKSSSGVQFSSLLSN